jgi:F-type H+-transporting ATPase subunit epsilon
MPTFDVTIVTPEGKTFSGPADSLVAPGLEGDFGVLAQHAAMIAALRRGILTVRTGAEERVFIVGEGVLEVSRAGVTVLAASAVAAHNLEEARSQL